MARRLATAAQVADKWASAMQQSTAAYKAGIDAVQVAPTELAAGALDRYQSGVAAAVASGKMERRLRSVSLGDWKTAASGKGAQRIGPGAAAAKGKYTSRIAPVLQHIQAGVDALPPRGDKATNIARMVQMAEHMMAYNG